MSYGGEKGMSPRRSLRGVSVTHCKSLGMDVYHQVCCHSPRKAQTLLIYRLKTFTGNYALTAQLLFASQLLSHITLLSSHRPPTVVIGTADA